MFSHSFQTFFSIFSKILVISIVCSTILLFFWYYQNHTLSVKHYTISSDRLPSSFDKFKIVQISDLHNKSFGKNQENLLSAISHESPDIILITGDLLSINHYPTSSPIPLLEQLVNLAPTYYSYGNHEVFMTYDPIQSPFFEEATQLGITFLNNTTLTLHSSSNESITLAGIMDPIDVNAFADSPIDNELQNLLSSLESLGDLSTNNYTILLAHRPEYFEWYSRYPIDLVFSGHAHGGIIQLPFIGGLYAPNQGIFPKYTSSEHVQNGTSMLISRGLGNSSIPFRLFNRPQLVSATLKSSR